MKTKPLHCISSHSLKSANPYDYATCIANTTHRYVCFVQGSKEWQGVFSLREELQALKTANLVHREYD